jgi:uncharacterized protein (DUF1330 family)
MAVPAQYFFYRRREIMYQKAWFFKRTSVGGISIILGLLLLTGCPFGSGDGDGEKTYTISFSPGEGGGTAPANLIREEGDVIYLPSQGGMTAPEGKIFTGWKAGGASYDLGAGFTVNADTVFTATWDSSSNGASWYQDFYNYPIGRTDQSGLLKITNTVSTKVMLFNGTVGKEYYIGTISSLGSVQMKLPEEKFYNIVAVEEENYKEWGSQATQFSTTTYYSNMIPYEIEVSPLSSYGTGNWVFNNHTNFWVEIKQADRSANYAVIAPEATRVIIPIALNTPKDYYILFKKELKYNGKTMAMAESTDLSQANIAIVDEKESTYVTNIYPSNAPNSVKPNIFVKNNSSKSVRVYYAGQPRTNGSVGGDFVIRGGSSQLVSGFEPDNNTNVIEFDAPAWAGSKKKVPVSMDMKEDKVYEIIIPNNENASEITVTEVDASKYYD